MSSTVTVTTTYLQLSTRAQFRPALSSDPDLVVTQSHHPTTEFYLFLYRAVGRDYHWVDRYEWTESQLHDYLAQPTITLLVLYVAGTPAGFIELDSAPAEPDVEIAYFGLIPAFHGRGYGKYLLSAGVQHAHSAGANRVWLHTCTLDSLHALANYRARGFEPYKTLVQEELLKDYP